MSEEEVLETFPHLERDDIRASLAFAADLDRQIMEVPNLSPGTQDLAADIEAAEAQLARGEGIAHDDAKGEVLSRLSSETQTLGGKMYGLIGKMIAAPGQRDALIAILLEDTTGMPGCLSYVIAKDPADADAIWITEVWDSEAIHAASLSLPSVKEAIAKARPLIAGFGERVVTAPVGGHGLAVAAAR